MKLLLLLPLILLSPLQEGITAYHQKEYPKAIIYFEQALSEYPESPNLLLWYAHALFHNKEFEKARSHYVKVLFLVPPDSPTAEQARRALQEIPPPPLPIATPTPSPTRRPASR